ncbi:MAG: HAMP domain-containing sensor histidine kinase [bacterium]
METIRRDKEISKNEESIIMEMSHNLQTPLSILKIELEELQIEIGNNKKLCNFEAAVDRISKFIYDILSLSKLERSEEINLNEIDASEVLNEMVEYFEISVRDKNIKIEKKIEDNVYINADRVKFENLVINLVSNAMKYIGTGDMIVIKLKEDEFVVEDNGIGIEKENLKKIFNRFYRAKNGKKLAEGSGLGLPICKKIIKLHGWKIKVESKVGEGSKFTVIF